MFSKSFKRYAVKSMDKLEQQMCEVRKVLTFYAQGIPSIQALVLGFFLQTTSIQVEKGRTKAHLTPFTAILPGRLKTLE